MPPDELLEASEGPSRPFALLEQSENSLAKSTVELLDLLAGAEDERDAHLRRSHERLRDNADDVASLLLDTYGGLAVEEYQARWLVTFALARLEDDAALASLSRILAEPVPPERSDDPHTYSTTAEETMIRLAAVDGVSARAAEGSAEAMDVLLAHLDHGTFSVRRALAQAFLAAGGVEARTILESRLGPEEQWLLEIEVVEAGFVSAPAPPEPHERPVHPERQIATPSRFEADIGHV